jgi:hypothetical protein
MQRTLILLNVVLLAGAAVALWLLLAEKTANQRLTAKLAAALISKPSARATQDQAAHEACRNQISRLEAALSNSTLHLKITEARLRALENQTVSPPPAVTPAPPATVLSAAVLSDRLASGATNRPSPAPPGRVFDVLPGANQRVLGEHLEFSGVYGRRVAFKEVGAARRVAFDVEQLHASVLAELGIDLETQKTIQAQQDRAWKQLEAASLARALADEKQREERKAAAEAAQAAAEKQMAEELEQAARDAAAAPDPWAYPPPAYWPYPYWYAPPPAEPAPVTPQALR